MLITFIFKVLFKIATNLRGAYQMIVFKAMITVYVINIVILYGLLVSHTDMTISSIPKNDVAFIIISIFGFWTSVISSFFIYKPIKEFYSRRLILKNRRKQLEKEFLYWYKQVEINFAHDVQKLMLAHEIRRNFFRKQSLETKETYLNHIKNM